jgi:hypothetical protein
MCNAARRLFITIERYERKREGRERGEGGSD